VVGNELAVVITIVEAVIGKRRNTRKLQVGSECSEYLRVMEGQQFE
jgi:hypothetical protein